ncbi:MAG: HesA/MoeB/ThiF family protein [Proteobacteria bacterium]|nr:HesA/MoeB/ThiF family protein [Pseudomonadota bacterium]
MNGCAPTDSAETLRRYARQLVLPQIGHEGQQKLLASSALVIGAGGLGSAALGYLAAAGVGSLGIVEHDRVELSNLQRQLLFETADIGRPKAQAAKDRLEEINPDVRVGLHAVRLTPENATALVAGYCVVLDGSDNFATRFAVHEACFHARIPLVSAAISGFSAQLSTFKAYVGAPHPCYRCLVPEPPEREFSCAQEGIIGPLAGMLGSMQALEAIKELLGIGQSLSGTLLRYDALSGLPRASALPRAPACPLCA